MITLIFDRPAIMADLRRRLVRRLALDPSLGEATPLQMAARVPCAGSEPLFDDFFNKALSDICAMLGHDVAEVCDGSLRLRTARQFNTALVPQLREAFERLLGAMVAEQWAGSSPELTQRIEASAGTVSAILNSRIHP